MAKRDSKGLSDRCPHFPQSPSGLLGSESRAALMGLEVSTSSLAPGMG